MEGRSEGLRLRISSMRGRQVEEGRGGMKEAEVTQDSSSPSLAPMQISHACTWLLTNTKPEKCATKAEKRIVF